MGSSPSKPSPPPPRRPASPREPRAERGGPGGGASVHVQTDDSWLDEIVSGVQSVPERLRAPTPPASDLDVEVAVSPVLAPSPQQHAAGAAAAAAAAAELRSLRPKSASHRLSLMHVEMSGGGTKPENLKIKQGAVGPHTRKANPPASSQQKNPRSEAKLQVQGRDAGWPQSRESSDCVYHYRGGNSTGVKWDEVHKDFSADLKAATAAAENGTYSYSKYSLNHAIAAYYAKKDRPQQSRDALEGPRVLRDFEAFDADEDSRKFRNADLHALYVAKQQGLYEDFRHLCWALTAGGRIKNEFELVRVLYTWFLCIDLFTLDFKSAGEPLDSTISQLVTEYREANSTRSETIGKLFETMARFLGIHCCTLNGYARGVQTFFGRRMKHVSVRHVWNAVNVSGQWRLVDVAWGFEKLSEEVPEQRLKASNDPEQRLREARTKLAHFYFLTNPEEFAWDHYSDLRVWQMVAAPVSLEEFEQRVELSPGYFAFGFEGGLKLHREIVVADAQYHISLKLSSAAAAASAGTGSRGAGGSNEKPRHRNFLFKALLQREMGRDALVDCPLNHYVALFRSENKGESAAVEGARELLNCVVRPPTNGDYELELFGKLVCTDPAQKDQQPDWCRVARLTLQVTGVAKYPMPFPCGTGEEYGPQELAVRNGLWTSECASRQETTNGVVSVRLRGAQAAAAGVGVPKMISAELYRMDAKSKGEPEDLSHLVEFWALETIGANVHLPAKGEYLLKFVCMDKSDPWRENEPLWSFLLVSSAASPLALVLNEDRSCGARLIANELGSTIIKCDKPEQALFLSHEEPFAVIKYQLRFHPENGGGARALKLEFERDDDINLNHYAVYESRDERKQVVFYLRFPKKGMYSLLVYSKLDQELENKKDVESSIRGCLFQYEPQAQEKATLPYPLGTNVMGALGPSDWGRERLELTDTANQQNAAALLKLSPGQEASDLVFVTNAALNAWARMYRVLDKSGAREDMSNYVVLRAVGLNLQLSVYMPAAGEYILELFGDALEEVFSWSRLYKDDPGASPKFLLWRSLIVSSGQAKQAAAIARLPLHEFGLSPVDELLEANLTPAPRYSEPFLKQKEQEHDLAFTMEKSFFNKPSVQLDFVDPEGKSSELSLQGWTFITSKFEAVKATEGAAVSATNSPMDPNRVSIKLRLPKEGFYVLSLFDEFNNNNRLIYSYLIAYEAAAAGEQKQLVKFPRQRRDWAKKYDLIEPMKGDLRQEDYKSGWVQFCVILPGLEKAAVFVDRDCYELDLLPREVENRFVGEVFLAEHFGKDRTLHVAAVLDKKTPNAYKPLLTYKIV